MKKQHVQLTPADRAYLEKLISQGQQTAKIYRRALGLLELDRGQTYTAVSKILQVTIPTISIGLRSTRKMG
jgi:putative transposase